MKLLKLFKLAFISIFFITLTACQSMNGAVGGYFDLDTDLQIDFEIDSDINPDELGKASPLFIRMYELKAKKMIKKADFIELYERDKEVLGADMLVVHKLKHFKPGESRTEHFVLNKATKYVVFYAEFLEFQDSKYKLIVPVVKNNVFRNSAILRVSGNTLIFDEPVDEEVDAGSEFNDSVDGAKKKTDKAQGSAKKAEQTSDKIDDLF